MFKTETLFAFIQVVKYGNFTAAANAQGQTPMAISKQVSQLEKRLGEPLFERTTRKVNLTQFGKSFLKKAKDIFEQHDSLDLWLESRQGKVSGTINIITQATETYDITVYPWVAEFCALYPDIKLALDVQEKIIDIKNEPSDIYWGISSYLGDRHPGLKRRTMWKAQYGIFASPEYLKKMGIPETPKDLINHQMIGYVHQQPSNILIINKTPDNKQTEMEYEKVESRIKVVARQTYLASQGLGLINMLVDDPELKEFLAEGQLVPVLKEYWFAEAEVFIYYQQVKIEQPKVRAFIDFFMSKQDKWI